MFVLAFASKVALAFVVERAVVVVRAVAIVLLVVAVVVDVVVVAHISPLVGDSFVLDSAEGVRGILLHFEQVDLVPSIWGLRLESLD